MDRALPENDDDFSRQEALAAFEVFATLDPDSLADLAAGVRERRWAKGATIFLKGEHGDYLLAVQSGRVRLTLSSPQGREIAVADVTAGQVLGEVALIDGAPRSATATAAEDTVGLILPDRWFRQVVARRPDVLAGFARHLCRLLRQTNYQMESIALYPLEARLARFLLSMAAQQPDTAPRSHLALGLTQAEIASILGASRPKVSQAFQSLQAKAAVRRDGDALVLDLDLLDRLATEQED